MGIGTSIALIAAGAILRYAITARISGIELDVVGLVLIVAGILGLVISLLYMSLWADRRRAPVYDDRPVDPRYPRDPRY